MFHSRFLIDGVIFVLMHFNTIGDTYTSKCLGKNHFKIWYSGGWNSFVHSCQHVAG
jgi:hypothetical protein